jgi:hypothetical protein
MAVLNEFDARAKTREQFRRAFYTTSKIDKIVIVPATASCTHGANNAAFQTLKRSEVER